MDSEGWTVKPDAFALTSLSELADLLDEHPEAAALWEAHGHHYYADVDALIDGLLRVSIEGPIRDMAAWAEDRARDLGLLDNVPDALAYHIDWQSYADDIAQNYTQVTVNGDLYLIGE